MNLMTTQCVFAALEGCVGVFAGNYLYGKASKEHGITNFQRILFATGFAYILLTVTETIRFFVDYWVRGASWQHYDLAPNPKMLFFAIFGHGNAGEDQYALLATNFRYFYLMVGALLSGVILLICYERKSKRLADGNGLFDDYKYEKIGFKAHVKSLVAEFRAEIPVWEYVLWWLLRVTMVWGIIHTSQNDPGDFDIILLCLNGSITFLVPIVRLIGYRRLFFGKMPFRIQSYIDIFVFAGSFMSHALELNVKVDDFDKYLHMLTGGLCILIGYVLIRSTRRGDRLPGGVCVAASCGFSCLVSIVWEIFEFLSDFYIHDSQNQNRHYELTDKSVFVKLFGVGAKNPGQTPLLDTNLDIIAHLAICILTTAILYAVVKKAASRKKAQQRVPACAVSNADQ